MQKDYICSKCGHQGIFIELAYWTDSKYKCPKCFTTVLCEESFIEPYIIIKPFRYENIATIIIDGLYIAGVQRHCIQLAKIFKKMKYQVMIIAIESGGVWYKKFTDIADYLFIPSSRLPINWKDIEKAFGINIVKQIMLCSCHLMTPIQWAIEEVPSNIKLYAHLHSEPSEHEIITTSFLKKMILRAKKVFFPTTYTMNVYKSILDFDTSNYHVLNNGLSDDILINQKCYPNNDKGIRIAIIARIDCDKFSVPLFEKTINQMLNRGILFEIVVAGNGDSMSLLRSSIEHLHVRERIKLLGFLDEPTELYQWANLIFLPSKRESMPYVMIESIGHQTPIVLPMIGIVVDDASMDGVFSFNPIDIDDVVNKIIMAKDFGYDEKNREKMIKTYNQLMRKWEMDVRIAYELNERKDY